MACQNSIIQSDTPNKIWATIAAQLENKDFNAQQLPKEMWEKILSYLIETQTNYKHLISFFSVNQSLSTIGMKVKILFPDLCEGYYKNIQILPSDRTVYNFQFIKLLTIDQKERHFFHASSINESSDMLYIFEPSNEGFAFIDLEESKCHAMAVLPLENGFVAFLNKGLRRWEFQEGTSIPKFKQFISFELTEEDSVHFKGVYKEKIFFSVNYKRSSTKLKYYDMRNNEIINLTVPSEINSQSWLGDYKGQLCWGTYIIEINENFEIKKISTLSRDVMRNTKLRIKYKDWDLRLSRGEYSRGAVGQVFCTKDSEVWMGPAEVGNPEDFFFVDDFLVTNYGNKFRMFHLPSKTEYFTKKIYDLLSDSKKIGIWDLIYLKFTSNTVEFFFSIAKGRGVCSLKSFTAQYSPIETKILPSS